MRALRGEVLLEAWERGANQGDLDRPLTLLAVASPGRSWDELADLSMAQLLRELLLLRRATFGDALRGCAPCRFCATRLEVEIQVSSILPAEPSPVPAETTWRHGSVEYSMRLVTSRDLAALASVPDPRLKLLELCTGSDALNRRAVADCDALAVEHFNRLNEGAEIRLNLQCPACLGTDQVDFDIGRFIWAEVRHAAVTLLHEVHELATSYGWSEAEILALGSVRRSTYLGMTLA